MFPWSEILKTHVEFIDTQHKKGEFDAATTRLLFRCGIKNVERIKRT